MSIRTSLLACGAAFSACTATHEVLLHIVIILSIMAGILLTFTMILSFLLCSRLRRDRKEPVQTKEGTGNAEPILERPKQPGSLNTSNTTKGQEITIFSSPVALGPSSPSKPWLEALGDRIKENHTLGTLIGILLALSLLLFLLPGFRFRHGGKGPILAEEGTSATAPVLEQAISHVSQSHSSLTPSPAAASVEDFYQGQDDEFHPEVRALVEGESFTKEAVRGLKPVPPKHGTVLPDYNPVLDEARPETMDEYLLNYRVFFVIDDSGSIMQHWNETRNALLEIADYALTYHSTAVDIRFFNSRYRIWGVQGTTQLTDVFASVSPSGWTPTGRVLGEVLDEQLDRLDSAQKDGSYSSERPLEIVVLTDGVPNSDTPPALAIEDAARRLKSARHHQNWISIQFVQIGDNPHAEPTLLSLIDCANNNYMVDTITYSLYRNEGGGKLTPEILERIVLGGLHPNLRSYQYRRKLHERTS